MIPVNDSDFKALEEYLNSRKLKPFEGAFYFSKPIVLNNKFVNGLVIVTYNLDKINPKIVRVDARDKKGWDIIYSDSKSIPIFGINKLSHSINKVIVVESALDVESFNQHSRMEDVLSIAFNRASFTLAQFHYLVYLSFYYKFSIYLAFDNDEAGKQATERFIKKANKDYQLKIGVISYPYKDFNDFLCKRPSQFKMFVNNKNILFKGV